MEPPPTRLPVAVLGATGVVGQQFVADLVGHPWFELAELAASPAAAGETYGAAVRWGLAQDLPPTAAGRVLLPPDAELSAPLVFSALATPAARELERLHAERGALVVTNASPHRLDADVPLVVPEVNAEALDALADRPPGKGGIVANPNCTTIGLALALAPLVRAFGLRRVQVTTLQALSGAGLDGPAGLLTTGNVLPLIEGEEEKLAAESRKILGDVLVSATCTRVPVVDGHTLAVSVDVDPEVGADALLAAWREFRGAPQELALPSAPGAPVEVLEEPCAPQPRLHAERSCGMTTVVGRLRPCPVLGWKFVALSNNRLRGAARGSVLLAELALARGLVDAG